MYHGKGIFEWQLVTVMESLTINMNLKSSSRKVTPNELNPFLNTKKEDRETIKGEKAWGILKNIVKSQKLN